nr:uncharacterized protein LOC122268814 [Parasteatoda tepidariorum]
MYKNSKKEDLVKVLEEIGGIADSSDNIVKLKEKIECSEIFKNDSEFVKNLITNAVEERVQIADRELKQSEIQIELEKLKLERLEKEMLLLEAKNKAFEIDPPKTINDTPQTNIENLIHSIKTLSLPVPSKPENFNQFFSSLKRAFSTKNINEGLKAEILINMLGEKANSILLYIEDDYLKNYEKLKALQKAKLVEIHMSLYPNESGLKLSAAISEHLTCDAIITPTIYNQLINLGQLSSSENIQIVNSKSEDFYECSCFNINDSCSCECFLFNIHKLYSNDEPDLSHVNDPCIRN